MEDGIGGIPGDFLKELTYSLGLGREFDIVDEGRIEIDSVECLETRGILDQTRRSCK